MASRIKGITVEIGGNTTGLDKALSKVNKSISNTETQLKDVNRLLKLDPKNTELLAQKQRLLGNEISDVESKLNALKSAQQQAKKQLESGDLGRDKYEALQREIIATEQKLNGLKSEIKGVGNETEKTGKKGVSLSQISDNIKNSTLIEASEQLSEIGDKIVEIGKAATETSQNIENSSAKVNAYFNETGDSADKNAKIIKSIYEQGVGESMERVADAVIAVRNNLSDLNEEDLSTLVKQAITLEDSFGIDMNETLRGVNSLMTQFGLTAKEALDYIVVGTQNGLDKTNELGDNVSEYAGKFAQAGYSAEEYFQLLENGLNNGAYTLDKVNDAINEVTNKLADGSISESLSLFSKDTQKVFKAWKDGEVSQKEVIDSIVNDIKNTKNEQEALNKASIAFGSLGEDSNLKFIESLSSVGDTFTDVNGKAQSMYDATVTSSQELEGNIRSIEDTLEPVGETILNLTNEVLSPLSTVLETIINAFSSLPTPIQDFILVFSGVIAIAIILIPIIASLAASFSALNISIFPIIAIVLAVAAVIAAIVLIIKNWGDIIDWLKEKFQAFGDKIKETWDKIKEWFKNGVQDIKDKITGMIDDVKEFFTSLPSKAKEWGKDFIQGLIDGIKDMVGKVQDAVSGVAEKIKAFLHFSRPDVGPLREYEKWMPDFMNGLANGIYDNIPLLTKAANAAASALNYSFMAESPTTSPIDYNSVYKAVRAGTADQSSTIVVDGRVLGRTLKGMGVAFT